MKRCEICNLPFWNEEQLKQHIDWHNCSKSFACTHCGRGFVKNARRELHEHTCDNNSHRQHHAQQWIQHGECITTVNFKLIESAFNGVVRGYRYKFPTDNHLDSLKKLSDILHGGCKMNYQGKLWGTKIVQMAYWSESCISQSYGCNQPPYFQTLPLESYAS